MTPKYIYRETISKGQIRLLERNHGDEYGEIDDGKKAFQFTLRTVSIDEVTCSPDSVDRGYTALSYTWGDENPKFPMLIDSCRFEIPVNLYQAIAHLYQREMQFSFWIDAVCINQENKAEKGEQLEQMAQVYGQAKQVLVWLGMGDPTTDKALESINPVGKFAFEEGILELSEAQFKLLLSNNSDDQQLKKIKAATRKVRESIAEVNRKGDPFPFGTFLDLMDRPWFERTWIIQELVMAQKGAVVFACGHSRILWEYLTAS